MSVENTKPQDDWHNERKMMKCKNSIIPFKFSSITNDFVTKLFTAVAAYHNVNTNSNEKLSMN